MPYGNIMGINAKGASAATAAGDRLGPGLEGSYKMAEIDLERMKKYRSIIKQAGLTCDVDPALIAGIISRESRAGNQLDNGWGDHHKAFGLMQVDVTPPPYGGGVKPVGKWDSLAHLIQATNKLVEFIDWMKGNFDQWSPNQHLQGALAAYNKGEQSVLSFENVDANTTGKDYSNDVIARAQWYKRNMSF